MKSLSLARMALCVTAASVTADSVSAGPKSGGTDLSIHSAGAFEHDGTRRFSRGTRHGQGVEEGFALVGPFFLRSAAPDELGELELKFEYHIAKPEKESEEHEFQFVLEWGIMEDWELIIEVPARLGEGGVEGNGDIEEFGFHIRHWRENGAIPAFAVRHLIRIPSGYHSSGVDYTARGLFTSTLIPGAMNLHFNPFLKTLNGNLDENTRNFQWGAAIGFDYRVSDDLVVICDYQHLSGEENGTGDQQKIELGADWDISDHEVVGLALDFGVDGDEHGKEIGAAISYIAVIEAGPLHPFQR